MKNLYFLGVMAATLLSSCSASFQVVETASSDVKTDGKEYVFNTNEVAVHYNLWDGRGNILFNIENKSNSPIYVDLDRSHLIVNGSSVDYYLEEETTTSVKSGAARGSWGTLWSDQYEVSRKAKMKKVVEVPPQSFITVGGRTIISEPLSDCGINKIKRGGIASSGTFTESDSPLTFRNYITYSNSYDLASANVVQNEFYVVRVHNMTTSTFNGKTIKEKDCPGEFSKERAELPFAKPQNIVLKMKSSSAF
ncbi:hypothetical protein [Pontibacter sp. SGAir0037]|uniref:hypothetical protein n=1 Tax=Pontibacter sp. SGAir0037 TaxID=2571030 RepID=UPI0010CCFBAD|nr:hypothetical protein [Pontibacter sp. SGAir0037]QCR23065.1 hypothetical protein C1N53_12405 [Pontibacter sp. SGAir0037]